MKKIILSTFLVLLLMAAFVGIYSTEYGWLLFNGNKAEKYATELLTNKSVNTPDWAIDLIVIKKHGMVFISNHGGDISYVYIPEDVASNMDIVADHLFGNWYVPKYEI